MKKRKMSAVSVGASSIITIFSVLCLIVFALLTLSTAKANHGLAEKSLTAIADFYEADLRAEEILSQIRAGNCPYGVAKKGNVYRYSCPIDENQELQVEVKIKQNAYEILQWKKVYTGDWTPDTSIHVWDGL